MTFLIFDVETTGLCDYKRPALAEGQPHICQLGAILTDGDGRVKAEMNMLVKPEGWSIPQAATDIHGIAQADAEKYGLSIKGVLSVFRQLMARAEKLVAHNVRFDLFMVQMEALRLDMPLTLPGASVCTMRAAEPIVKLPRTQKMIAAGMDGYKAPSLQEAYRHFFGKDFEGAHDAMADVRACRDVFFRLQDLEKGVAA